MEKPIILDNLELESVRIIIPTCKREVATLNCLSGCPVPYEIVVSKKLGLGAARNDGAKDAWGSLLLFLDDDLTLTREVWSYILNLYPGEFAMTFLSGFPCSRVLAVYAEDFWSIGGFDENIRFTGEDRDFYVRALEYGLKFKEIPMEYVKHVPHERRSKNIWVAIGSVRENMQFIVKYWRRYPTVFKVDFLNRFKRFQLRTLLLEFIFLLDCITLKKFVDKLNEWDEMLWEPTYY